MGLLSSILGFFGFGLGTSIGLVAGYYMFIYFQPSDVKVCFLFPVWCSFCLWNVLCFFYGFSLSVCALWWNLVLIALKFWVFSENGVSFIFLSLIWWAESFTWSYWGRHRPKCTGVPYFSWFLGCFLGFHFNVNPFFALTCTDLT